MKIDTNGNDEDARLIRAAAPPPPPPFTFL